MSLRSAYCGDNVVQMFPKNDKPWRELIYFPIVYYAISFFSVVLLFAISPESLADYKTLNIVLYSAVVVTHWLLTFLVIRKLRRQSLSLKEFIVPKKRFGFLPAVLVFVSINVLFSVYIVLALAYGRIPRWDSLDLFQFIYFLVAHPLTAGFVEELIWRGYFIEKLLSIGYSKWRTVIFSSISFAFIHGFWVIDKLAVTFIFGIFAGAYYIRERNLLVLMLTHVVVDVISFALLFFA